MAVERETNVEIRISNRDFDLLPGSSGKRWCTLYATAAAWFQMTGDTVEQGFVRIRFQRYALSSTHGLQSIGGTEADICWRRLKGNTGSGRVGVEGRFR